MPPYQIRSTIHVVGAPPSSTIGVSSRIAPGWDLVLCLFPRSKALSVSARMAAVPTSKSSALSLKDYLRRYETGADDQKKKRNKKKKDKPQSRTVGGILVVDEDPVWQKPVQIEQEESEPSGKPRKWCIISNSNLCFSYIWFLSFYGLGFLGVGDEKPQIEEDIEVKRMKRLDAIRARKPYHAISEDGSGWVSISDPSKTSKSAAIGRDICPPRQGRARFDTPSPEPKEKPSGSQNSDLSPPRQRRADTPSPEPEKAVAGDGTADISPPWRRSRDDNSPPRRTRRAHSPVPDLSPPRRSQKDLSDDPKVSSRQQDPVDLSPPRRRQRVSSPDISLPRRTRRLSPGAGGPRASDDADLSPPRKSSKCLSDHLSPPRRIHPQSPEAIRRQSSPVADLSPPRKSRKEAPSAKESRRAGLFSAKEIKEEIEKKKKEDTSRWLLNHENFKLRMAILPCKFDLIHLILYSAHEFFWQYCWHV